MGQDLTKHTKVAESNEDIFLGKLRSLNSASSNFSDKELKSLVKHFYNLAALSPQHNCIDKATFEHYFPLGGILARRLFVAFDTDKNGLIDLQEFLDGMALCLQGSLDEKSQVAFEMFDIDETNGVAPWELHLVLKSVLATTTRLFEHRNNKKELSEVEMDHLAHRIVQDAFKEQSKDLNEENKMTLKVFKSWIEKHPFVLDSIFGQSCLKEKGLQYSRLGSEERLASLLKSGGMSSVKKQTWVDGRPSTRNEVQTKAPFNGSYDKADYLWTPVFPKMKSKPSKRCKLAACLVYDSVYIYGGRGICTALKDMWRYDIGENAWFPVEERGEDRPSYLQEHTMLSYKSKLVIFGGEFTSLNETPLWFFDLNTCTWSRPSAKQKGPVNRRGHTAVISGDVMYVFGGYIDIRGATRELWKYEFSTNTWTREKVQSRWPSARYSHSAAVFDKSMVIYGGLEEMQCKNDMWLWNMASCKWTRIKGKNSPPPLFGHSAVKVGDGMLVFGGESSDGTLYNTLWRFNFDTLTWSSITPKGMISPSARSYHSIVQIPNFLFTSRRPTSSRSAPPPTPGYDRELPRLDEESDTDELSSFQIRNNQTALSSVASLGSLDSTALLSQAEDEVIRIKVNTPGSLDSLVTSKVLLEAENMSMINHDRNCYTDETLVSQNSAISEANNTSISSTTSSKLLHPTYGMTAMKQQVKPQSVNMLIPPNNTSLLYKTCDSDDGLRSGIVHLMVLGGTSKRGIESVDRWVDTWKCQIDPEKRDSAGVKRIEVQSTGTVQYNPGQSYDSAVAYENLNITDNANDNDYYDDSDGNDDNDNTITECVLLDISDGDSTIDSVLEDRTAGRKTSLATVSI